VALVGSESLKSITIAVPERYSLRLDHSGKLQRFIRDAATACERNTPAVHGKDVGLLCEPFKVTLSTLLTDSSQLF